MARWADRLTPETESALKALYKNLLSSKPSGWSVVFGHREVVVRPANRQLGKFSFTCSTFDEVIGGGFFSRPANCWTERKDFPGDPDETTTAVVDWMVAIANADVNSMTT